MSRSISVDSNCWIQVLLGAIGVALTEHVCRIKMYPSMGIDELVYSPIRSARGQQFLKQSTYSNGLEEHRGKDN
jgi:hypothetical protein